MRGPSTCSARLALETAVARRWRGQKLASPNSTAAFPEKHTPFSKDYDGVHTCLLPWIQRNYCGMPPKGKLTVSSTNICRRDNYSLHDRIVVVSPGKQSKFYFATTPEVDYVSNGDRDVSQSRVSLHTQVPSILRISRRRREMGIFPHMPGGTTSINFLCVNNFHFILPAGADEKERNGGSKKGSMQGLTKKQINSQQLVH